VLATAVAITIVAVSLAVLMVIHSRSHTIHGAMDVGTIQINSGCRLSPRYAGIAKGTQVTVSDSHGAVLARTSLGFGKDLGPYCEFLFSARVPDRTMYRIEVDHRGSVTYSKAYLGFFKWHVGLALKGRTLSWI
jgi:hypothetical protein